MFFFQFFLIFNLALKYREIDRFSVKSIDSSKALKINQLFFNSIDFMTKKITNCSSNRSILLENFTKDRFYPKHLTKMSVESIDFVKKKKSLSRSGEKRNSFTMLSLK